MDEQRDGPTTADWEVLGVVAHRVAKVLTEKEQRRRGEAVQVREETPEAGECSGSRQNAGRAEGRE